MSLESEILRDMSLGAETWILLRSCFSGIKVDPTYSVFLETNFKMRYDSP